MCPSSRNATNGIKTLSKNSNNWSEDAADGGLVSHIGSYIG